MQTPKVKQWTRIHILSDSNKKNIIFATSIIKNKKKIKNIEKQIVDHRTEAALDMGVTAGRRWLQRNQLINNENKSRSTKPGILPEPKTISKIVGILISGGGLDLSVEIVHSDLQRVTVVENSFFIFSGQ